MLGNCWAKKLVCVGFLKSVCASRERERDFEENVECKASLKTETGVRRRR